MVKKVGTVVFLDSTSKCINVRFKRSRGQGHRVIFVHCFATFASLTLHFNSCVVVFHQVNVDIYVTFLQLRYQN